MVTSLRVMSFLAPNLEPFYRFVSARVGQLLGIQTEFIVGSSYAQLARGEADLAFVCGLPYVVLNRDHPPPLEALVAPVLLGERYGGAPIYFSDVIVQSESRYQSFQELRGCRWVYNEELSQSGYGIVRETLRSLGETEGYFGEARASGFHQRSIQMVLRGEADASAIDSHVLAVEMRDDPAVQAGLRVIEVLGPSPIQPLAASTQLPQSLREDITETLLRMGDDPGSKEWMNQAMVGRFVRVGDSNYRKIELMLRAAESVGFTEISGSPAAG